MRRWAYLGVPIGAALLIGGSWAADQVITAPPPALGPAVLVTPGRPSLPPPSPEGLPASPSPQPTSATVVSPAPPQDAGDDDDDDDADDADDDGDDD